MSEQVTLSQWLRQLAGKHIPGDRERVPVAGGTLAKLADCAAKLEAELRERSAELSATVKALLSQSDEWLKECKRAAELEAEVAVWQRAGEIIMYRWIQQARARGISIFTPVPITPLEAIELARKEAAE